MKMYDFVIIGHGAAAFAAAIKANELGVKTAMIGTNETPGTLIGGTCVNVGCVPSKTLITIGNDYHHFKNGSFEGIKCKDTILDFFQLIKHKDRLVEKFRMQKYSNVLEGLKNVTYIKGKARFISKSTVEVNGEKIEGKKFLIATGAKAKIIPLRGLEEIDYLTNEEALNLKKLPESLCVIGGRTLGLEFAQMFSHFGTKVTVLQRNARLLPQAEPEISKLLEQYLVEEGLQIYTGMKVNHVRKRGDKKLVHITYGGKDREIEVDHILFATGRKPNTEYLQLGQADVAVDNKGFVKTDAELQTTNPAVWAAGDVIGEPMLETVAAKEGNAAVINAFTQEKKRINYIEVPKVVFTYPEVASVGLTDEEANQNYICNCRTLPFELVPKAAVIGDTRGAIKLVLDNTTKRILGVHIIAPHAADLIHEGVLAVKNKLTIDDIIDTVHVFPTLSEAYKLAALSFYKDIGSLSCCTE